MIEQHPDLGWHQPRRRDPVRANGIEDLGGSEPAEHDVLRAPRRRQQRVEAGAVRQRRAVQDHVLGLELMQVGAPRHDDEREVAVGEDAPLGRPSCRRCRRTTPEHRQTHARVWSARRASRRDGVVGRRRRARSDAARSHLHRGVGELRAIDQRGGARVGHVEGHVRRPQSGVDRNCDQARFPAGEERLDELGTVAHPQHDAVAPPSAEPGRPAASASTRAVQLGVGSRCQPEGDGRSAGARAAWVRIPPMFTAALLRRTRAAGAQLAERSRASAPRPAPGACVRVFPLEVEHAAVGAHADPLGGTYSCGLDEPVGNGLRDSITVDFTSMTPTPRLMCSGRPWRYCRSPGPRRMASMWIWSTSASNAKGNMSCPRGSLTPGLPPWLP